MKLKYWWNKQELKWRIFIFFLFLTTIFLAKLLLIQSNIVEIFVTRFCNWNNWNRFCYSWNNLTLELIDINRTKLNAYDEYNSDSLQWYFCYIQIKYQKSTHNVLLSTELRNVFEKTSRELSSRGVLPNTSSSKEVNNRYKLLHMI